MALQLGGEPEDPVAAAFARTSDVQVCLLWSFYHGGRHCASTNPVVCCFGLEEGPVCPGLPPEPVLSHHGAGRCNRELVHLHVCVHEVWELQPQPVCASRTSHSPSQCVAGIDLLSDLVPYCVWLQGQ